MRRLRAFAVARQNIALNRRVRDRAVAIKLLAARKAFFVRACADDGAEHRNVYLLPRAGALALLQGREYADDAEQRRRQIGERHAYTHRRIARLARRFHHAAQGLNDRIQCFTGTGRLALIVAAEAVDRTIHDARVDLPREVISDAQTFHHAAAEILYDDVGVFEQVREQFASERMPACFRVGRHQRAGLDGEDIVRRHHIFQVRDRTRAAEHRHRRVHAFQAIGVVQVHARRVAHDFNREFRLAFAFNRRPGQAHAKQAAIEQQ
jgi:AraC-like DNA-binding protein